uniref:C-CAP/cofactor C-like domain-containing protein n=1 Tax=Globisporangium ultimum (strain ATCC 200006 / CBS 805.95 / DAOM BR144) TaxID=431595 RepID=K3WZP0_GLOUD
MAVFTASDGTTFEDRNAWRKYEFETNYTFRDKQAQTLMKVPGQIGGQPFDLSDLDACEVLLLDQCDQVQIDSLSNCRVFIGPCSESVFVRNCTNCVFTVACKQLRTRDSSQCSFYLYSLTDPIIETSKQMQFAPFNGAYNGIERHFADARLEPTNNHWSQVYDFNDPDKTGDNWKILAQNEEAAPWVVDLEGHVPDPASLGPCANPVAHDSGFIKYVETNSTATASFSFKTSQKDAEKVIQAQTHSAPKEGVSASKSVPAAPPASSLPLPVPFVAAPSSGAVPPPLVAMFAGAATVVHLPPPPAPVTPPALENQKVAIVEAAEHLTPPPRQQTSSMTSEVSKALPPLVGFDSTLAKEGEPAVGNASDMLEALLNLGPSTPAS